MRALWNLCLQLQANERLQSGSWQVHLCHGTRAETVVSSAHCFRGCRLCYLPS